MILVRAVGISGYVPLECVVGLSHVFLYYRLDKGEYKFGYRHGFEYLGVGEIDKAYNPDILRYVVSFAVVRRFDESVLSILVSDVGLLFGYYCAGVVFPNRLRSVFRDIMGLIEYHNLSRPSHHPRYSPLKFVYTSAWYEYICLEPDASYIHSPPIFIRILESKNPFPDFLFNGLRRLLSH